MRLTVGKHLLDPKPIFKYPSNRHHQRSLLSNDRSVTTLILTFSKKPDAQSSSWSVVLAVWDVKLGGNTTISTMWDPKAVVPYHDPHDMDHFVCDMNVLSFSDNCSMSIDELLTISPVSNPEDIIMSVLNSSDDDHPYVKKELDAELIPNPLCYHSIDVASHVQNVQHKAVPQAKHGLPLTAPNAPFSCSYCHLLGEIVHTNGNEMMRLEVHGMVGMVDHGILWTSRSHDSVPICEFLDFGYGDAESVKPVLAQYCENRRLDGFEMVQDLLTISSHATFNGSETACLDASLEHQFPFCADSDAGPVETDLWQLHDHSHHGSPGPIRTALAIQRERSSKLKMEDFKDYFHLPIEKAANELGVCTTVVKKICRKYGLGRWPHRKIKSLKRQLGTLNKNLEQVTGDMDRASIQSDINRILQQIDDIRREAVAGRLS